MSLRQSFGVITPLPLLRWTDPEHTRLLKAREYAEPFNRYMDNSLAGYRSLDGLTQRLNLSLVGVAEELHGQVDGRRLHPGYADVSGGFTAESLFEVLLNEINLPTEILAQFGGKKRSNHVPALSISHRRSTSRAA